MVTNTSRQFYSMTLSHHQRGEHRDFCRFCLWFLCSKTKLLQKSNISAMSGKCFPHPVKNLSAPQISINIAASLMRFTPLIFPECYSLWDMDPAVPSSLNHTRDRKPNLLTVQYSDTSIHQPKTVLYSVFSSLWSIDSRAKVLRISLHSFTKNT